MKKISIITAVVLILAVVGQSAALSFAVGGDDVFLPVILTSGNPPTGQKTSSSLIEEARQTGQLDDATAAVYQVFAVFNADRLPPEFRGAPDPKSDIFPMDTIVELYASLTPQQKAAVDPYLKRPDDPASWLSISSAETYNQPQPQVTRPPQDRHWETVRAINNVIIHYQANIAGDDVKAAGMKTAIDNRIYDRLFELIQREWMPDDTCSPNGGNGMLDVYLVHGIGAEGLAVRCRAGFPSPSWIVLEADRPIGDDLVSGMVHSLTHEMFHTIQNNYRYLADYENYRWIREATAMWSEDLVYRDAKSEHPYASNFLQYPFQSLEDPAADRHYGAYLWPFYLTRIYGADSRIVAKWFEDAESMKSLEMVAQEFAGSDYFKDQFAEFSLLNWNQDPVDSYNKADSLTDSAALGAWTIPIQGVSGKQLFRMTLPSTPGVYPHLSAQYYHFKFTDDSARSVAFYNGINYRVSNRNNPFVTWGDDQSKIFGVYPFDPVPDSTGMHVQALMKINGVWTQEDWSGERERSFCRDVRAERLEELVIILSNSNWKVGETNYAYQPEDEMPMMYYSDMGCWRWKGQYTIVDTTTPGVSHSANGEVTFERRYEGVSQVQSYQVVDGHFNISVSGTDHNDVTWNLNGSVTFGPDEGGNQTVFRTYNLVDSGPYPNAYYINALSGKEVRPCGTRKYETEDGWVTDPWCAAPGYFIWTPFPPYDGVKQLSDGSVISGTYDDDGVIYTWTLTAEWEP